MNHGLSAAVLMLIAVPVFGQVELASPGDLIGVWRVIAYTEAGKKGTEKDARKYRLEFSDGKFLLTRDGKVTQEGSYAVGKSKQPNILDVKWTNSDGVEPRFALGIYEINGDELRICFCAPEMEQPAEAKRPRTFLSTPESGWNLNVYRREPSVRGNRHSAKMTSDSASKESEPRSLEEALARMEKIFGRYNPESQMEWRVPAEFEYKSKPTAAESEVLMIFKGLRVIGHPFREAESISFDEVLQWQRQVYDVADAGRKTLTRTQRSHNVTRYSLSRILGTWFVSGMMLSNGVHSCVGKQAFTGIVRWHPNEVEFIGNTGIGEYYGAGGKMILGTTHEATRYSRVGNQLLIKSSMQPHHLASDGQGSLLVTPDFKRPIGARLVLQYQSEAIPAGKN